MSANNSDAVVLPEDRDRQRSRTAAKGDVANHRAEPSLGSLVADAQTSFSTVLHGEIELAKLEVKSSVKNAGTGVGMFAGAAVLLVFSLTFGLIALAEGLVALHIWRWAAYLIVFGLLVLIAALLSFIGYRKVKRVKAPEQTIATTKDTVTALRQATSKS
ncbi:phage holin family protein [Jatrophihabitans sp. DSM 45814]